MNMLYWRIQGRFSKTIIVLIIAQVLVLALNVNSSNAAIVKKRETTISINDHDIVQHNDGVDNDEANNSRPTAFGEKVTKLLPQSNDDDDNDDGDGNGGSSLLSERVLTGRLILNKVSQESKEEKANSLSDDKEREGSGESLEIEFEHAASGMHFTTEGIKPEISSNMSSTSQQNHAKVISAENEFTSAFTWQTSTPRVDKSHANISTTNVRSVPELIMSTTLTTQDNKDIEKTDPKVTTTSAPKLSVVTNSFEESNEIRVPIANTTNTSEKRGKFINDHTTNSQQLNLPDATEVWTLAGMKAIPKSNVTNEHKEDLQEVPELEKKLHRENVTLNGSTISPTVSGSSNSEKNLLDWTQIMMSGELDTTKYDGLMEHSTQTSIVPSLKTTTQPQTSLEVATIQPNITSQEPFENRTEVLLNVTVDATDENTELVTKETSNQTAINMESTTLSSQLNEHINTNVITTTTIESTTEANEVILTKTALPNATNYSEFTTTNPTLSLAETNNNNTTETLSANDEDKHDEHNNNNTSTMSNIDDEPQNANKTTKFDPTQRAQVEESTENSSVMESMTTTTTTTTTTLPSTTVVASATTPLAETIALNSSGIDEGTIYAFTPTFAPVSASTETIYTRNATLNANYNDDLNVTATSGAGVGVNVDANVDAGANSTADVHTHATTTVELSSSEMTTVSTLTTGVTSISTIANVSEVVTGDVDATTSKIIVNETSANTSVIQGVANLANDTGKFNEHIENNKGNLNTNIEQIEKPIKSENDANIPETTISSYANELLIHKTNYTLETEEATTETTPKRATDASVETSTTTTTTTTKAELFKTIDDEQTTTTPTTTSTTTIAPVTVITTTPVAVVTLDPVLTKPTGVVHGQISHETESSLETNDIDATDSKTTKTNNLATSTAATTTTTSSIIDDTNIAGQQQHNKSDFPLKEHQANTLGEEEQQNNEDILLSHITTTPATTMDIVTLNIPSSTTTTTTTISPIISTLEDKTTSSSTTTTSTEPPLINLLDDSTTTTPSTLPSKSTKVEEIYSVFPSTSSEKTTSTSAAPLPTTPTTTPTTTTNTPDTSTAIPATQLVLSTVAAPITTTMLPPLRASIGGGNADLGMMPTNGIPMGMPTSNLNADSSDPPETDVNVIIAISVSVIGVIALILLVAFLYLMRKRQKQMSYGQRCRPVSLDAYSLDNVSVLGSVRRKGVLRASKRSYGNAAFDDPSLRHNVLNAVDLTKFVERRSSIFEEFREVPQIHARADEVPAGCEDKNRYANVVPLPETRVILQQQSDDEKTEYINANYVRGPKDPPNYYIACQAPLESTVTDFWRMIWEQQSRVIIQATDLSENGIEKCAEYLPPSVTLDNHTTYGDFQVTLKNRDVKDRYAISTLLLKNTIENASRELTHYWYKWPEMGVPTEEAPIIAMLLEARSSLKSYAMERASDLKEQSSTLTLQADESGVVQVTPINAESTERSDSNSVNVSGGNGEINGNVSNEKLKITTKNQGPLTVHCSPGTGRTGTIIACDMAIRSLETPKRSVDIPQIVYYVRRGRASAVQTKEQYEFIYKVTSMYATKITNLSNDN